MADNEKLYQINDMFTQFNDYDKALLFKMGVNDEDELNTLLAYYRDRVNDIDKERTEWLEKLEEVKIKVDQKHKQEWENQKRVDEIAELQRTITELKVGVFDERQLVLKYSRENDALKIKEVDDRKKIQELLSLSEPIEETIVLQKDLRPQVSNKFVQNDLNIYKNKENFQKAVTKCGGTYTTTGGKGGRSVVKTIYLPNETLNTVTQENECLKRQLEKERQNFLQQINTLKEELQVRDDEHKLHYNQQQAKIQDLIKDKQVLEKQHLGLTKDFFQIRQKFNDSEKKLHEENELLRLRNTALANKLVIVQKQTDVENKVSKELLENKCEEYTNKFRNQVKKKDDSLQIMKNQYAQAQKIYLGKVRELEESLSKLAEKYYSLERRRNLESQGYKNDLKDMTKKLEQQEIRNFREQYQEEEEEEQEPSLTRSEKEFVKQQQSEKEFKRQQQSLQKQKDVIYGGNSFKKSVNKKTMKKKPVNNNNNMSVKNINSNSSRKYQQQQQQQQSQNYMQQQQFQDDDVENNNEDENQSETVEMEELEDIQQQLNDLEKQLAIAKNQ